MILNSDNSLYVQVISAATWLIPKEKTGVKLELYEFSKMYKHEGIDCSWQGKYITYIQNTIEKDWISLERYKPGAILNIQSTVITLSTLDAFTSVKIFLVQTIW